MNPTPSQVDAVIAATSRIPKRNFTAYRGGYPKEISSALIDAVFSIQAKYDSSTPGKGVFNRVRLFRTEHPTVVDDFSSLIYLGADQIERIMGSGKTGGRLKATAVVDAAAGYMAAGVNSAKDFHDLDAATAKRIYTRVQGLGYVTFEYFSMLLGTPGVKTDIMIKRFIAEALSAAHLDNVNARTARELVKQAHAATGLGKDLTYFEHALWLFQSTDPKH
ncbi:hypothetical protein [Corynebacterium stationis]|uniref:hypothetical protein n=1 Tax=Corynebacterium stationis TaxID=1705 RepID=UPI002432579A|nr:hypothetical protein [Corynebacterium stationis]